MTIAWSEYRPFVAPEVAGCPVNMLDNAIREAAIEFCKLTSVHHVATLAQAVTAAGTRSIAITTPAGSKAWEPLWVNWHRSTTDFSPLTPKAPQDLDVLVPGWRSQQDTPGSPLYYTMRAEASLVIAPWPDANGTVDYDMAFIPTPTGTGYIDDLFNLHYAAIVKGAKAKLFQQASRPWANVNLGAAYERQFMLACSSAGVREARGKTDAVMTTDSNYR